ncbi:unnamed protein product [Moneuplotes crassus]|uniref:USP domain-containing protein n=1 Tax=Euplotes crassus TaxID=5936 RepID=A0AAD1UHL2_EUPCR|nr:unnamed protein product [Moneuplotes crassus]
MILSQKESENTTEPQEESKTDIIITEIIKNRGILNSHYDCFINSAFQALLCVNEFVDYYCENNTFIDSDESTTINHYLTQDSHSEKCYSSKLKEFITEYFSDSECPIWNKKFRTLFDEKYHPSQQHDASDFLMCLFEILQNEHNPTSTTFISSGHENGQDAWQAYERDHISIVDQLFVGMYETVFTCCECEKEAKVYEEFNSVPIECHLKDQNKGFKTFIESSEKQYSQMNCEVCYGQQNCTIQKKIIKYPKYLILVFQRFDSSTNSKITDPMDFHTNFTLQSPKNNPISYSLFSSILHSGSLTSGHYTSICKRGSNWFEFNDCSFKLISNSEVKTPNAYILFYKQDPSELQIA